MAQKNCELLKGFGSCHSWKLQQPTEPRSISRHENQKYHPHTRLQNSQVRNARAVKQKVWNEAENRERHLRARARPGESLFSQALRTCEARARKTLAARFTDFFTDFEKKNDCFAVYAHTH